MSLGTAPSTTPPEDGWQACLDLGFEQRAGRTVLARRRRLGPLAVQRSFHPEGGLCHVYLLHPPGGVVGGDRLDVTVDVAPGAQALITAPGAAKFYRSAGAVATLEQRLHVAPGASLEWLPHENIFFDGARVAASTRIELPPGARFIGWEMHCLGRPASRAPFLEGEATARLEVVRENRPLLLERLQLTPGRMHRPAQLRGNAVTATVLAAPVDAALRDAVRAAVAVRQDDSVLCAVTVLDDLLALRAIGPSTEQIRRLMVSAWQTMRPVVIGRDPCPPRIWAT